MPEFTMKKFWHQQKMHFCHAILHSNTLCFNAWTTIVHWVHVNNRPWKISEQYAITRANNYNFSSPVPGRPAELRCWGNKAPEFSKELSLSEPVMFEIRPAGKVSITQSVVLVANEPSSSTVTGSFIVELRFVCCLSLVVIVF